MKTVKEFHYKGYVINIAAEYSEDTGVKVDGEWKYGEVILYCTVYDIIGNKVLRLDSLLGQFMEHGSKFYIGHENTPERYGFLKLKKRYIYTHISEEYERVFPEFLDYCKTRVDELRIEDTKEKYLQRVTDGLPDSLKDL